MEIRGVGLYHLRTATVRAIRCGSGPDTIRSDVFGISTCAAQVYDIGVAHRRVGLISIVDRDNFARPAIQRCALRHAKGGLRFISVIKNPCGLVAMISGRD